MDEIVKQPPVFKELVAEPRFKEMDEDKQRQVVLRWAERANAYGRQKHGDKWKPELARQIIERNWGQMGNARWAFEIAKGAVAGTAEAVAENVKGFSSGIEASMAPPSADARHADAMNQQLAAGGQQGRVQERLGGGVAPQMDAAENIQQAVVNTVDFLGLAPLTFIGQQVRNAVGAVPKVAEGYRAGQRQMQMNNMYRDEMDGKGEFDADTWRSLNEQARATAPRLENWWDKGMAGVGGSLPQMERAMAGATIGLAGASLASMYAIPGAVAAPVLAKAPWIGKLAQTAAGAIGSFTASLNARTMETYADLRERGTRPETARKIAPFAGAMKAAVESAQLTTLGGVAAGKLIGGKATQAILNSRLAKNPVILALLSGGSELGEEDAQAITDLVAREIAFAIEQGGEGGEAVKQLVKTPGGRQKLIDELANTTREALPTVILFAGLPGAASVSMKSLEWASNKVTQKMQSPETAAAAREIELAAMRGGVPVVQQMEAAPAPAAGGNAETLIPGEIEQPPPAGPTDNRVAAELINQDVRAMQAAAPVEEAAVPAEQQPAPAVEPQAQAQQQQAPATPAAALAKAIEDIIDAKLGTKPAAAPAVATPEPVQQAAPVVATQAEPTPVVATETPVDDTQAAPQVAPELMTPEQAIAQYGAMMNENASDEIKAQYAEQVLTSDINKATAPAWAGTGEGKPVNAAAVDRYQIPLPTGYVLEGDRYVFTAAPEEQAARDTQVAAPAAETAPAAQAEAPAGAQAEPVAAPAAAPVAEAPAPAKPKRRPVQQAARKLAKEQGIDLDAVQGTGRGGAVTLADVQAAVAAPVEPTAKAEAEPPAGSLDAAAERVETPAAQHVPAANGEGQKIATPAEKRQARDALLKQVAEARKTAPTSDEIYTENLAKIPEDVRKIIDEGPQQKKADDRNAARLLFTKFVNNFAKKLTFDVPGDGTFKVFNTAEALDTFAKAVEKRFTVQAGKAPAKNLPSLPKATDAELDEMRDTGTTELRVDLSTPQTIQRDTVIDPTPEAQAAAAAQTAEQQGQAQPQGDAQQADPMPDAEFGRTKQGKLLKRIRDNYAGFPPEFVVTAFTLNNDYKQQKSGKLVLDIQAWIAKSPANLAMAQQVMQDPAIDIDKRMATGIALVNHLRSMGSGTLADNLMTGLVEDGRTAGRAAQMAALLNLQPGSVWMKMFTKYLQRRGLELDKDTLAKIAEQFKIADEVQDPQVRHDATIDAAYFAMSHVPYTFGDFLGMYRYGNALSNPRSHLRNIYWNAMMTAIRPLTLLAAGKPGEAWTYTTNAAKALGQAAREAKDALSFDPRKMQTAKEMEMQGTGLFENIQSAKQAKALGGLGRGWMVPGKMLVGMDKFFTRLMVEGEAARLRKQGYSPERALEMAEDMVSEDLVRNLLGTGNYSPEQLGRTKLGRAANVPLQAVNALDWVGRQMVQWREKGPWLTRYPVAVTAMFIKTTTQLMKMQLKTSGMGLFERAPRRENFYKGAEGDAEFAEAKERYTRRQQYARVGLALSLGGMVAALMGDTQGPLPEDEKERQRILAARGGPWRINIGGKWIPFAYFGPWGLAMAMPTALRHAMKDQPDAEVDGLIEKGGKSMLTLMQYLLESSPIEAVSNMANVGMEGGKGLAKQAAFQAQQFIPASSFLRWMNTLTDKAFRKTPPDFWDAIMKDLFPFNRDRLFEPIREPDRPSGRPGDIAKRTFSDRFMPYGVRDYRPSVERQIRERRATVQEKRENNAQLEDLVQAYRRGNGSLNSIKNFITAENDKTDDAKRLKGRLKQQHYSIYKNISWD
jgi:hypothetical protein